MLKALMLIFVMSCSLCWAQSSLNEMKLSQLPLGSRVTFTQEINILESCKGQSDKELLFLYFIDGDLTCSHPGLLGLNAQMSCRIPVKNLKNRILKDTKCSVDKAKTVGDNINLTLSCGIEIQCKSSTPCLLMNKLGECENASFKIKNFKNQFKNHLSLEARIDSLDSGDKTSVFDEPRGSSKATVVPSSKILIKSKGQ